MKSDELRDVPGLEGRFAITSDGRLRSRTTGVWRKAYLHPHGYWLISIYTKGKSTNWRIHRMVAEAWLPNPNCLPFINHKDGNKQNNQADNLEWCSKSQNMQHAWDTGLRVVTPALLAGVSATGKRVSAAWAKLTIEKARSIRALSSSGMSRQHIADIYGVSRAAIRQIVQNRSYKEEV